MVTTTKQYCPRCSHDDINQFTTRPPYNNPFYRCAKCNYTEKVEAWGRTVPDEDDSTMSMRTDEYFIKTSQMHNNQLVFKNGECLSEKMCPWIAQAPSSRKNEDYCKSTSCHHCWAYYIRYGTLVP